MASPTQVQGTPVSTNAPTGPAGGGAQAVTPAGPTGQEVRPELFRQFMELLKQLPYNQNGEFSVKLGDLEYFDGSRRIYNVELVLRKKEYLNKTDYAMTVFYTVFTRGVPKGIVPPELIEWGHRVYAEYYLDDPRDVMQLLEWEGKCGLLTKATQMLSQVISEHRAIAQQLGGGS